MSAFTVAARGSGERRPELCSRAIGASWREPAGAETKPRRDRGRYMDSQTAQQRYSETMASQRTLQGMSDEPGQYRRQDPMMQLINQCHRARSGQDGGMEYLTVPF
ncbi:hypothetical protein MINTM018_34660 [Mycobacterium intracellulare]|uniref:Uncharacterized protein n=2 Tax=Mycobacterium intracellulare TaxID=1767 RepID=A0A7R7RQ22_MYCIT|nr:hypothetical protein MINTM018_34660 [Mycobacterium intracellulare]